MLFTGGHPAHGLGATGVTELDAADTTEPYALDAVTVNVYAVPFDNPVMAIGDTPVPVKPPGEDVAVNVVVPVPPEPPV
jgi:hypothetical protein